MIVFGGAWGSHFLCDFEKCVVFEQKPRPSNLNDSIAFWLDFQGLRLPRITKNPKKGLLEKHRFLGFKKVGSKVVFLDFLMFLGSILEFRGDPKSQN